MREVYVWEFPVRLYHWVNALCVTALCITGFLIGNPLSFMKGTEAISTIGSERCDSFILSSLLCSSSILYSHLLGFVGNEFSRWYNLFRSTLSMEKIVDVIRVDILQVTHKQVDSIVIMRWRALSTLSLSYLPVAMSYGSALFSHE